MLRARMRIIRFAVGDLEMAERINFQQSLNSKSLAVCLTEILKYVLYMKAQIPQPCDQLLRQHRDTKSSERKPTLVLPWREKQLQARLERLQYTLSNLHTMCTECGEGLTEMAIVLGATLVHPNTVVRVKLEAGLLSGSAPCLAQGNLKRFLVKSLVCFSFESCGTHTSPTNCFIVVKASRSLHVDPAIAVPRLTFKLASKSTEFCIELAREEGRNPDLERSVEKEAEACSHQTPPAKCMENACCSEHNEEKSRLQQKLSGSEDQLASLVEEMSLADRETGGGESFSEDSVWFQVVPVVQGFKELPHYNYSGTHTHGLMRPKLSTRNSSHTTKSLEECTDNIWA